MTYLVLLDYDHLDNGLFLTAFAGALSQHSKPRFIILHGDSQYTERIMQTGVMREEAQRLSIKGLNHRLVALFADEGISCLGLNGYQRNLISRSESGINIDRKYFEQLPEQPVLLLSNLVSDSRYDQPQAVPLDVLAKALAKFLEPDEIFLFSRNDSDEILVREMPKKLGWDELNTGFAEKYIPHEFHDFRLPARLTTARLFRNLPDTSGTTLIS